MDHVGDGLVVTPGNPVPCRPSTRSALLGEDGAAEDRPYVVLKLPNARRRIARPRAMPMDQREASAASRTRAGRVRCVTRRLGTGDDGTTRSCRPPRRWSVALRVVLDSTLRLPPTAQILGPDAPPIQ